MKQSCNINSSFFVLTEFELCIHKTDKMQMCMKSFDVFKFIFDKIIDFKCYKFSMFVLINDRGY